MNATSLARRLADEFERAGVEYAVGGALAYGYWGNPRGTLDVDITVFVTPSEFDRIALLLENAGCELNRSEARTSLDRSGYFKAWHTGVRIDVFFPDVELYAEAYRRRASVELEGRSIWIWSAEIIVTFKLMYFRPKDKLDIERVWERLRDRFDAAFVRSWLLRSVGADDERTRWWDEITSRHP